MFQTKRLLFQFIHFRGTKRLFPSSKIDCYSGLPTWLFLSQICQFWLFSMLFGFGKIVWLFGLILAFFMSKKTIYILNFPISITWGNGFQEVGNLHPSTKTSFQNHPSINFLCNNNIFKTIQWLRQTKNSSFNLKISF